MTILHIAHVGQDRLSGVNVAVPAHIKAQGTLARVGLINLGNVPVEEAPEQFPWTSGLRLEQLPQPFDRPDLVVFHEIYRLPFLKLSAQLRRRGIPYVIIPHGGLTGAAQKIKAYKKIPANALLFNRYIRGAAAIQCLSSRELEQTRFPGEKFVAANGVELGPEGKCFSAHGMRFVYIGRMDYHIKGLDLMLQALARERELLRAHHCRVDLYGPAEEKIREKLMTQCLEYGLEEILRLHGPVTGAEKAEILAGADCYIQTSRSEGMSMGILEALGWGIPCLVTEGTGMAELARERDFGWGCATDPESIAEALRQAVLERETLHRRSVNARALAEERFTWSRTGKDAMEAYGRIVARRKSR